MILPPTKRTTGGGEKNWRFWRQIVEGYFHELDRKDNETAEELELTVQVIREKLSLSEKRAVSECMGLKELFYYCMV